MAKSRNMSASSFVWSLVNMLPKPLKCFVRLLENILKPDSGFWMTFTFQGRSGVSWRWWMYRAIKHQQNDRKCWKSLRTHLQRPLPNNPWTRRHHWDQSWSVPGDLNRKLNMHHIAPSRRVHPHVPENHSACDKQQHGYHSPSSLLARFSPLWFHFVSPNWKWNLWDDVLKQCLTSKGNHKWYSTALRKVTSTVLLKRGKKRWDDCICSQGDYFEGDGSQNWVS
jgi:hypothetical protein